MHMPKVFEDVITYVSGAVSRIFGLDDDNYPSTGIQPFSGDTKNDRKKSDW